ncbi:hypothetical protein J2W76_001898 [Methylorubrum zatmanii]|nr:hypothetical protein [Methylorubrum zatmanii]MCP1554733.1 hypothetical protein [Methylorubrum extorquens]MCP1578956.1 hypothetical protein [Methylorubrum extorquens]
MARPAAVFFGQVVLLHYDRAEREGGDGLGDC